MSHDHDEDRDRDRSKPSEAGSAAPVVVSGKRPAGMDGGDVVQLLGMPLYAWSDLPQLGAPREDGRDSRARIPAGMTLEDLVPAGGASIQRKEAKPEAGPRHDDRSPEVRDQFPDVSAATNLKTRIVSTTVERGRTRLRFGAGGYQGVKPLVAVKLEGLEHETIEIDKIDGDTSFAFTDLPIDAIRVQGRGRSVTINPGATKPPRSSGKIQRREATGSPREAVHAAAARGVASPSTRLPFLAQIQASFGAAHDVSGIEAHVGGDSAAAMGAVAYATGNHVVFDREPDLHTAAHEAAHVIQQRRGVQLAGGVGQAGDAYEGHADAVADRVVQGRSAADLLGGGGESELSASHGIQRKPGPAQKFGKQLDHKAGSWVHPSQTPGTHLVGKIFFRTKDSTVDAHDRSLLAELARAYAGNKTKPVRGNVEGFADPRPSHRPANADLSQARASTVARALLQAFAASSAWYEHTGAVGRGVDPTVSAVETEDGPEDLLAPYRRVDIYLDGMVEPDAIAESDRPHLRPDGLDIPDDTGHPFLLKHGYNIRRGDKPTANGVAMQIKLNLGSSRGDGIRNGVNRALGIREVEPSWWKTRLRAPVHGRGGYRHPEGQPEHVRRVIQLVHDYDRYLALLQQTEADARKLYNSGFKDVNRLPEGPATAKRLGELQFLVNQLGDEAEQIMKITR